DTDSDGHGHDHKATVLDNEDAGLERFRAELDQRFDALAEKLGESQEAQQESVAKIITASFETAFKALEDSGASHRAEMAAARIQVLREEPVYRFDGSPRSSSFVRDWLRAQTERD